MFHFFFFRSLGVSQLGVVINKLDTVGWSKDRFDEIVAKLKIFLKQAGFKDSDVSYIPCSGLTGENLVKKPADADLLSWYNGPTLISVIGMQSNLAIFRPKSVNSLPFQMASKRPNDPWTNHFACQSVTFSKVLVRASAYRAALKPALSA